MATVFPNQKACGKAIMSAFKDAGYNHVLLLAQMQMGKSGTYWYVVFNMLFGNCGVKNVLVISGNRERELRAQVLADKLTYTEWYLNQKHVTTRFDAKQIRSLRNTINKRVRILWGDELGKDTGSVQPNTLIVWDESHFAQSRENKPFHFIQANNLEGLVDGSKPESERNVRLLTVSATPFSELVVNTSAATSCKMIRLEPSDNYYGVAHYRTTGAIQPSFRISEENTDAFKVVLHPHIRDQKYALVRVNNQESLSVVRRACDELNVRCAQYNAKIKEITIDALKDAPDRFTVVVVSGMLRMGKVVPKDHIALVFESSTQGGNKKADTVLQGLLGRMCGYTSKPGGFDPKIYIEEKLIDVLDTYIERYDATEGPLVEKAMNVCLQPPQKRLPSLVNIFKIASADADLVEVTKKELVSWLAAHICDLNLTNNVKTQCKSILGNESAVFHIRDTEKKSNGGWDRLVRNMESEGLHELTTAVTKSIDSDTVYLLKCPSRNNVWVAFKDEAEATPVEQEDNDENNLVYYVLNRCVYKPLADA